MTRIIRFIAFLIVTTAIGQNSVDVETQVKNSVDTFFEGFHKGDTLLMKSVLANKVVTQTVTKNKEGKTLLGTESMQDFLKVIGARPANQKWKEKLLDYKIQVDGNMAHVWTPYEFWFNDSFSHCGVNSFQLFNDNGTWKIIYLIDTRRRAGCQD
ncbi:nuclear transport factor 2 family protein [Corallibacter vietnamensis]|uniref:nuclear transport factor 2 family protein n=1 Tax=Corallibacter vietnamensis TaxID=904130 RepID=UPI0031DB435E